MNLLFSSSAWSSHLLMYPVTTSSLLGRRIRLCHAETMLDVTADMGRLWLAEAAGTETADNAGDNCDYGDHGQNSEDRAVARCR